jgi:enoyl-CoA hydratase
MAFESDVLTLEAAGPVATLWLDRPDARNAMGSALWRDLPRAAQAVANDDSIRVLILAAKGTSFTVGLDLKEMGGTIAGDGSAPASKAAASKRFMKDVARMQQAITCMSDLAVPVIAAVHGYCIGGGVDLITACDIRLASAEATFSVREAKIAIVADLGTLQRLPRIIGAGHVAELALTGKDISAERAAQIGLVNHVCGETADDVYRAAQELAAEIAANSPLSVQGTKAVLAANDGKTIAEGLDYVARWNAMYIQSNDLREAMMAFLERRPPVFNGD